MERPSLLFLAAVEDKLQSVEDPGIVSIYPVIEAVIRQDTPILLVPVEISPVPLYLSGRGYTYSEL